MLQVETKTTPAFSIHCLKQVSRRDVPDSGISELVENRVFVVSRESLRAIGMDCQFPHISVTEDQADQFYDEAILKGVAKGPDEIVIPNEILVDMSANGRGKMRAKLHLLTPGDFVHDGADPSVAAVAVTEAGHVLQVNCETLLEISRTSALEKSATRIENALDDRSLIKTPANDRDQDPDFGM